MGKKKRGGLAYKITNATTHGHTVRAQITAEEGGRREGQRKIATGRGALKTIALTADQNRIKNNCGKNKKSAPGPRTASRVSQPILAEDQRRGETTKTRPLRTPPKAAQTKPTTCT